MNETINDCPLPPIRGAWICYKCKEPILESPQSTQTEKGSLHFHNDCDRGDEQKINDLWQTEETKKWIFRGKKNSTFSPYNKYNGNIFIEWSSYAPKCFVCNVGTLKFIRDSLEKAQESILKILDIIESAFNELTFTNS